MVLGPHIFAVNTLHSSGYVTGTNHVHALYSIQYNNRHSSRSIQVFSRVVAGGGGAVRAPERVISEMEKRWIWLWDLVLC